MAGDTESGYVTRITTTLRSTLRDANTHFVSSGTSYDYTGAYAAAVVLALIALATVVAMSIFRPKEEEL